MDIPKVNPDAKTASAISKFKSLPQVMDGAPGSDEAIEKFKKAGKPFVIATAYREIESCKSGEHDFTNVIFKIIQPKSGFLGSEKSKALNNLEFHEADIHGAKLGSKIVDYLSKLK